MRTTTNLGMLRREAARAYKQQQKDEKKYYAGMLNTDYHWSPNYNMSSEKGKNRINYIQNGEDYSSSAIYSVLFHPRRQIAEVRYNSNTGKVYDFPMEYDEFESLQRAPSKGRWMYYLARRA